LPKVEGRKYTVSTYFNRVEGPLFFLRIFLLPSLHPPQTQKGRSNGPGSGSHDQTEVDANTLVLFSKLVKERLLKYVTLHYSIACFRSIHQRGVITDKKKSKHGIW
jgi:hypothetical protein